MAGGAVGAGRGLAPVCSGAAVGLAILSDQLLCWFYKRCADLCAVLCCTPESGAGRPRLKAQVLWVDLSFADVQLIGRRFRKSSLFGKRINNQTRMYSKWTCTASCLSVLGSQTGTLCQNQRWGRFWHNWEYTVEIWLYAGQTQRQKNARLLSSIS